MIIETIDIPTPDGVCDALVAFPGTGPHPGVLLYTDIFGIRPVIEDLARELAGHGYVVLVPNVFYRHGRTPVAEVPEFIGADARDTVVARLRPLLTAHTPEFALRDAEAYLGVLADRPEVADGPIGAVGYCMGAVLAMRTAAAHPDRVAAVGGFHPGRLYTGTPDSPHLRFGSLTARVHLGLAETDLAGEARGEVEKALAAAGVDYHIETYPGAAHGFTMADTEAFDADARQRHWDRLLPLLSGTLSA
ncbi:MAG TPA: dienelactone hydrolase family protein [Nocardia sp.]|uniref:dienelactone hydrolase family protein n=1 Tax=Nocardia sp. TaxID=1821 RepID=UPI002B4AE1EF|nr:dienelactone hydrolase family protein [Nocardia sp.]HLS77653.1 dienelactone hydrolase family protein [Nocardia sp.]